MDEKLLEIAQRIRGLREICDITAEEAAERCGMSPELYAEYETGTHDFNFSFLATLAELFGVDVIDIMTGETPRLSVCSVVHAGEGFKMERRKEYKYENLAYAFRDKKMEPFMVTVDLSDVNARSHMNSHPGQEMNYIIEGEMIFYIASQAIELKTGDCVYYDAMHPHSMQAVGGVCRFLSIIAK